MEAMACNDIITSQVPHNVSCAQQWRYVVYESLNINQIIIIIFVDLAASAQLIHQIAFKVRFPQSCSSLILHRDEKQESFYLLSVVDEWGAYYLMFFR